MNLGWLGQRITVEALLGPLFPQHPDIRVGWPDDTVWVRLWKPLSVRTAIATALSHFRKQSTDRPLLVDIDPSVTYGRLDIRFVSVGPLLRFDSSTEYEAARQAVNKLYAPWIAELGRAVAPSGGKVYHGNFYFELSLPLYGAGATTATRDDFPEFTASENASWDALYQAKLRRTSWTSLRDEAYRFSKFATKIADWAVQAGGTRVLVPSTGLCVDPWLFAHRGLNVVATDVSETALDTIERPERLPNVYGLKAKERWDIHEHGVWGGHAPDTFEPMPDVAREEIASTLRPRIELRTCDWTKLPLDDASVDVIFATNALPREDAALRARVLDEWIRVLKPEGLLFNAMHNDRGETVRDRLENLAWKRVDALRGERAPGATMFQEHRSSG